MKKAGGGAIDGHKRVLEVETTHIHDTTPCFLVQMKRLKEY